MTPRSSLKLRLLLPRISLHRLLPLLFVISTILLSACQNQIKSEAPDQQQITRTADDPTDIPPPVIRTISAPSGSTSFTPADSNDKITPELSPSLSPTSSDLQSDGSSADPSTIQAASPALLPTYTSPPQPETDPWDHYWFRRPVPEGTSVWTDKSYPYGNTRGGVLRPHHGVEFNVPRGTQVLAASSGQVVLAGEDTETVVGPDPGFYGKVVVIQHDFSIANQPVFSVYGHLSELLVEPGHKVESGEVIAFSGASGVADGPHLHFETRVGDNSYQSTRNPLLWLYPFPDRGVVAGLITWPDGMVAYEVPVTLRRLDADSPFAATTTYAEGSINSDDNWGENFALDDTAAGYYLLTIGTGENKTEVELWVYSNQTNFVQIQLGE